MFDQAFGHEDVSILDGGLPKWLLDGCPVVTTEPAETVSVEYTINKRPNIVRSMKNVEEALRKGDIQVSTSICKQ